VRRNLFLIASGVLATTSEVVAARRVVSMMLLPTHRTEDL
jgi:hypothetical protein